MITYVTGANGFIGEALCRLLVARGHDVHGLVRDPAAWTARTGIPATRCSLPQVLPEFSGVPARALIHLAFTTQFRGRRGAEATNLDGFRGLYEAWHARQEAPFIFVSSMSAHDAAESIYGRSKYLIERGLDSKRDLIIRPGFVLGAGGLCGRLMRGLAATRLVPLFYGGRQQIQTVWLEDLTMAIARALELGLRGELNLADSPGTGSEDFYLGLARRQKIRAFPIPVPGASLLLPVLRSLEKTGLGLPVTSENLLGLKQMRPFLVDDSWHRLGITPRTFQEFVESSPAIELE